MFCGWTAVFDSWRCVLCCFAAEDALREESGGRLAAVGFSTSSLEIFFASSRLKTTRWSSHAFDWWWRWRRNVSFLSLSLSLSSCLSLFSAFFLALTIGSINIFYFLLRTTLKTKSFLCPGLALKNTAWSVGEFGASARVMLVIGTLPCPCATACARSSKEEYTLNVLVSSTCSPAKQQKETGPPDLCQYSTRPTSCGQTVTTWLYVMPAEKNMDMSRHCGWYSDLWQWFFFRHIFSYTSFWHMQACTHVHLMLLALFFSSSVHSIAEPLINGLFFKKKKKKKFRGISRLLSAEKPRTWALQLFKKRKKNRKKSRCVCALSSYYGP